MTWKSGKDSIDKIHRCGEAQDPSSLGVADKCKFILLLEEVVRRQRDRKLDEKSEMNHIK